MEPGSFGVVSVVFVCVLNAEDDLTLNPRIPAHNAPNRALVRRALGYWSKVNSLVSHVCKERLGFVIRTDRELGNPRWMAIRCGGSGEAFQDVNSEKWKEYRLGR